MDVLKLLVFFASIYARFEAKAESNDKQRVVCYYKQYTDGKLTINTIPNKCTHLVYSYAMPDNNYEIISAGNHKNLLSFVTLKDKYPNKKLLISIAKLDDDRLSYWKDILDGEIEYQRDLCKNMIRYARKYNFDGIDLNIQPEEGYSYGLKFLNFMSSLHDEITQEASENNVPRLLLSLFSPYEFVAGLDDNIMYQVDWVVINGAPRNENFLNWVLPGRPNLLSAINNYNIYDAENYAKVTIAISYLGAHFNVEDGDLKSGRRVSFPESCKIIRESGLEKSLANEEIGYYIQNNNLMMTFDDPNLVKKYVSSIDKNIIGGIAILDLDLDDLNDSCDLGKLSLTFAAIEGFLTNIME